MSSQPSFVATPNAERHLLDSGNLAPTPAPGWRERRRIWPAVIGGLIVMAIIAAAIAVYGAFGRPEHINQQQQPRNQRPAPRASRLVLCTQSGTLFEMRIETLSVREAREQLPSVLARFRDGDHTPVGVGSHRKMEAIIVPVEVFDELVVGRAKALAEARASLRLEGLSSPAEAEEVMARWASGEISTTQMRKHIRRLAGAE